MAYSSYELLQFEFDSGILRLSINHPPFNLLDSALGSELDNATKEIEVDQDVRVLILQSAIPDFFIAHSGLGRIGDVSHKSQPRSLRLSQQISERLRTMPKVTIAKIEGLARGGGSEFALGADMRFGAIGKAVLSQPEVGIGLTPGGGATQRLPHLIGRGRALEVILGCDDFPAELAEKYGYIDRALPADELGPFVEKLARRIASFPTYAVIGAKKAVNTAFLNIGAEGFFLESDEFNLCLAHPVTQKRISDILKLGAETEVKSELELNDLIAKLPSHD